jgi:hypothetical protein
MSARIVDWLFGSLVLAIAVLNLALVHPVPGLVFLLASLVYLPPANAAFQRLSGVRVPVAAKVALGVAIVWFTLGVSDLGDLID